MKLVEEINGKAFTNDERNNKIKSNKPLISKLLIEVNLNFNRLSSYNRYTNEREGLFMRKTKNIILNEEIKELNLKERFIIKVFGKTFEKVYRLGMIRCFNYYNK